MTIEPGRNLLHYRIVEKIGEGGMGAVWRAVDTTLDREVAIKILPAAFADDPDRLARFEREAKTVAGLSHPNIVTLHSVQEVGPPTGSGRGVKFITMELVRGRSLSEVIAGRGLPLDRLLELAIPLCDAVAAAHRRGITHRDLKPDNVMIDEDGRLKVLDFGLAKIDLDGRESDETVTQEGRILGTVAYMSPEQAQGKAVDPRSDVFSLGILLYEMTTGRRPFEGDNNLSLLTSILRDTPQSISDSDPSLPPRLDGIVRRCLDKDPSKRYETALGLKEDLEALRREVMSGITSVPPRAEPVPARRGRWLGWVAGVVVAAIVLGAAGFWVQRGRRARWARTEAIPRIEELRAQSAWGAEGTRAWEAFDLATEAERVLGDDPALEKAWNSVAREIAITSEPPGAEVWAKAYATPDGEWRSFGRTPLEELRFPVGVSRIKVELADHRTAYDVLLNSSFVADEWRFPLKPEGSIPDEMVFVAGDTRDLFVPGIDHLEAQPTGDFLIDRYEVTNREYKRFVDAGGYESPEFWKQPFRDGDRTLSWEEARARLVDATGRPGPASWEAGGYPEGEDDYPVRGVSWYEAAAYAGFAGKSLPTVFHWNQVAFTLASGEIVPVSNFDDRGPVAVGGEAGMNRYGVFDLAGNVREWVRNGSTRDDQRFILGGGWNDPGYAFNDAFAQSPWNRTPTNGFRCIRYLEPGDERPELTRPIEVPFRDFYNETPVSDETFALFRRQFDYDRGPLDAVVEAEDEYEGRTRVKVAFNAAYGDERMFAYLFLPHGATPPYKTVVVFPGSSAIHDRSSENRTGERFAFLMRSGRAVMFPIYKSTYERGDDLDSDYPDESNFWKDHVIMWGKDLARSIDYLETREDIDTGRLAYFGFSWGGAMGAILPAVEPRIRINVLYVAGLLFQRAQPEVDQINYVSRVTQPTLMVNGEYDFFFPVETSQKPLYDLLGTPEGQKKYVVYPGSHSVPRVELMRESLDWLERWEGD